MILHELQGNETAGHKGGREGKEELTGGEPPDELTGWECFSQSAGP
jgi:hypothetical protein